MNYQKLPRKFIHCENEYVIKELPDKNNRRFAVFLGDEKLHEIAVPLATETDGTSTDSSLFDLAIHDLEWDVKLGRFSN